MPQNAARMPASGRQIQNDRPKVRRQQRVGIGADRVERDVAEIEQPGETDHDVQPPAEHHIGQHQDAEIEQIAVLVEQHRRRAARRSASAGRGESGRRRSRRGGATRRLGIGAAERRSRPRAEDRACAGTRPTNTAADQDRERSASGAVIASAPVEPCSVRRPIMENEQAERDQRGDSAAPSTRAASVARTALVVEARPLRRWPLRSHGRLLTPSRLPAGRGCRSAGRSAR